MSAPSHFPETRLTFTLSPEHKDCLERAAAITGLSLADYVIHQALNAAMEHIAQHDRMVLSNQDRDIYLAALEHPPEPNEALKLAVREHQEQYGMPISNLHHS